VWRGASQYSFALRNRKYINFLIPFVSYTAVRAATLENAHCGNSALVPVSAPII
jgi:hypothetical protein